MIKRRIALISVVCAILAGSEMVCFGAEEKVLGVDPALIAKALEGKKLIFRRKYDEAYALFGKLAKEYPDSPTGLAGQMAIWQVRMFEEDDFRYKKQFTAAEKEYEKFATAQLRKGEVPPWDLFIYGAADGMRGFFATREEKWLNALTNAMHAMRMLKKLKWMEPGLLDVDLGFGAYTYWRSAVTNEIKILPFFSDRRQEGIDLLKKVAAQGEYVRDLALGNLVFIYGNEEKFSNAIEITDQLLAIYPENIIMRYQKGRISLWAKKYDQALKMFEEVYSMDPSIYKAALYQGVVLIKMKDMGRAKASLMKYLQLDDEKYGRAIAYYWLGMIAESEKDIPAAKGYYEKSQKLYKLSATKVRLKHIKSNE